MRTAGAQAIKELEELLKELHNYVDVIVVEGFRDVTSLKSLTTLI